jgi:hypothetical protein
MLSWIFYFQLIIQSFIASSLVLNGWHDHYVLNRASESALLYGAISVQYVMVALPFGMLLGLFLFGYRNNTNNLQKYLDKKVVGGLTLKDKDLKFTLYFVSLLAIIAVLYVLKVSGGGALLSLFKGGSAEQLSILRIDSSRGFSGNVIVKNIFAIMLAPLLTYISYAYWKMSRKSSDLIWFYIMLFFSFLILTYDLSKSPFIYFSVGFLFLNVFINGGVSKKVIYTFSIIVIVILVMIYVYIMDVTNLFTFNSGILGRVLLGQAAGTYMAFNYFPSTYDHIGFSSFSGAVSSFLNLDYSDRAGRLIMMAFNPKGVESGAAGVMNSLFIAEAWANWGLLGVIVAPIYIGIVIQLLYMFFLKSKKTPLLLGSYAYIATKLPITGGANDFIYSPVLVMLFLIMLTIYSITVFFRKASKKV